MHILISNDDGIGAPGIESLARAVDGLGRRLVVAPDREHSGCGHQVTTHAPIWVEAVAADRHAVGGTPADCVRIGLRELGAGVTLALTGINPGGNLGVDVFISGTVAAAREAVFLGVPAIAFSQYRQSGIELDWERAERWTRRVVDAILADVIGGPAAIWNVNFPALPAGAADPELVFCPLDTSPLPVLFHPHDGSVDAAGRRAYRYCGVYADRPRRPGRDVDVCLGGNIAITRLDA